MTFTPYETIKRLVPEIEEWEARTEQAHTNEETAAAIAEHEFELIDRYTINDLIIILEFAFDRIVNITDGTDIIPMDFINGNEYIYRIYCEDDVAYIEI